LGTDEIHSLKTDHQHNPEMPKEKKLRFRLLGLIDQFSSRKLIVIGDLIADEFLYGRISRVSREAPVLILRYRNLVRLPGGAANAANNLLDLGCKVGIVGVVGMDEAGRDLVKTLAKKGADVSRVTALKSYTTPLLTRILAGAHHSSPQQIVRVDRICAQEPPNNRRSGFSLPPLRKYQAIVLSDYGYGFVNQALVRKLSGISQKQGIPLLADSRFRISEFNGVTSMTPNITELEAAAGMSIGNDSVLLAKVGRRVIKKQNLKFLLVTQGRFGMTLIHPRRAPVHVPIYGTDEVADVTGAGDTVIAVFTLALACGAAPEDAMRLANYAGGIVVMKRGTATVSEEELRCAVKDHLPV
jgi:rfaE bifunctional protein kinase chain/domain